MCSFVNFKIIKMKLFLHKSVVTNYGSKPTHCYTKFEQNKVKQFY